MDKTQVNEIFDKVKEHVRQTQEEVHSLSGIFLEDISRELNIKEEMILDALAHKALFGELVETDIFITFND